MKSTLTEYLRPARAEDVPALMALRTEKPRNGSAQRALTNGAIPRPGPKRSPSGEHRSMRGVPGSSSTPARSWGTVSRGPVDRDFWTDEDHPETAFHLYKAHRRSPSRWAAPRGAPRGLGIKTGRHGRSRLGAHRHLADERGPSLLLRAAGVQAREDREPVTSALRVARSTAGYRAQPPGASTDRGPASRGQVDADPVTAYPDGLTWSGAPGPWGWSFQDGSSTRALSEQMERARQLARPSPSLSAAAYCGGTGVSRRTDRARVRLRSRRPSHRGSRRRVLRRRKAPPRHHPRTGPRRPRRRDPGLRPLPA